jgi:pyruvate dehydrogenase E2 component (dihydrolipoamide acetyltransferase)
MSSEIKLPKLKENVDTVEVTEILVAPGQMVQKDQPLIVVNADKSSMEVYAPMAGKVVKLQVKVGDELKIGAVYCLIEAANGAPSVASTPKVNKEVKHARNEGNSQGVAVVEREPTVARSVPRPSAPEMPPGILPASPATRWLARKLGVDLTRIKGTGPKGRITEEDVKAAHTGGGAPIVMTGGASMALPALPNFEEFGPIIREPLTRVRKLTAQKMSQAWSLIPHVTQHDLADVTHLEAFRKQHEPRMPLVDGKPVKLTTLAFVMKACVAALKRFPTFNSTLDLANNQLIVKKHYHLGIAVDTRGGLLVPVIRDVDKKSIEELAIELIATGEKARNGKADMNGGTFTITNLGGIGGTGFTPIVNYPEVAILGLSRGRLQPVVHEGQIVPRLMMPLSLSYDHRVIDGADAARFTRFLAEALEDPWLVLLKS